MRSQDVQAVESFTGRVVSVMDKDGVFRDKTAVQNQLWAKGPMKAFLPEGYPYSVTADYASTYTFVDYSRRSLHTASDSLRSIQDFSSGTLSKLFVHMFVASYQAKPCSLALVLVSRQAIHLQMQPHKLHI